MSYDCVVIGAGMSGITSALALARNGMKVALTEKAGRTAPLVRGFTRRGIRFDTGFHYAGGMGAGGTLDTFFRYLGISERITPFPFDESGFDTLGCAAEGFRFRFPSGYPAIREALCAAFPGERTAIESYLARVQAICDSMPYQNLDAPVQSEAQLSRVFGPTLKEALDGLTRNRLLKSLLSMHTLLYGVASDEVSFAQHAVIVGNYYHSACGIRGGGASLAAACDARLAELGVDVFRGSRVTGIEPGPGGEFRAVRIEGGEAIQAKRCIATIDPRLLLDLVPEGIFRPAYGRRLAGLEETFSAFLAYGICKGAIPDLAGRNLFLLPDAAAMDEVGTRGLEDTPLYLSGAYRDGESAPRGFIGIFPVSFSEAAAFADARAGQRPAAYRKFKEQALGLMRRRIESLAPEVSGTLEEIEASTPLTLRDFCGSPAGGLYGVKHMVGQYNPLPATRMKGLYLAGQALVAPGVMGAVLSGLLACGTILGHEHMRKELKGCC